MDAPKISKEAGQLVQRLINAAFDTVVECADWVGAEGPLIHYIATLEAELAKARGAKDEPLPAWVTDYPPTPGYNWRAVGLAGYIRNYTHKPVYSNGRWLVMQGRIESVDPNCVLPGGPDCLAEYVEAEGRWYMRGTK